MHSETVAAYVFKVGRCIKLNELMSVKGHGHSMTLAKGHSDSKIKSGFSKKLLSHLKPNFL